VVEAAMEAGRLRLRPILMTAFAFIFGVLPLMFASGAGAASRQSLGTAVFGGMVAATALTLVFVPVFYALIERARKGRATEPAGRARPGFEPHAEAAE
jgi:multidrug efflux pump subunit AcrB